jgi:hypothetical protein
MTRPISGGCTGRGSGVSLSNGGLLGFYVVEVGFATGDGGVPATASPALQTLNPL